MPDGHNGAAYVELIKLNLLPSWALVLLQGSGALVLLPGYVPESLPLSQKMQSSCIQS